MDALLNPFVPMKAGQERQYEGGGLGLLLVKELAELHGGRLEVQSEDGKGARFTVCLRLAKSDGDQVSSKEI